MEKEIHVTRSLSKDMKRILEGHFGSEVCGESALASFLVAGMTALAVVLSEEVEDAIDVFATKRLVTIRNVIIDEMVSSGILDQESVDCTVQDISSLTYKGEAE